MNNLAFEFFMYFVFSVSTFQYLPFTVSAAILLYNKANKIEKIAITVCCLLNLSAIIFNNKFVQLETYLYFNPITISIIYGYLIRLLLKKTKLGLLRVIAILLLCLLVGLGLNLLNVELGRLI